MIDCVADILSLLGAAAVVYAYHRVTGVHGADVVYYLVNLLGAVALLLSLLVHPNLGSIVIELFWICISIHGLQRRKLAKAPQG